MRSTIKGLYAMILKSEREVMFYDDEWVYTISQSSDGDWDVNVYTMEDHFNEGEETYELRFVDGGRCTGDEYDAIEFMMPKQLIDMDNNSPQTRKAHT